MWRLWVSRMNGPIRYQANESKEVYISTHLFRPLKEREVKNIVERKKEMTLDFSTSTMETKRQWSNCLIILREMFLNLGLYIQTTNHMGGYTTDSFWFSRPQKRMCSQNNAKKNTGYPRTRDPTQDRKRLKGSAKKMTSRNHFQTF